MEFGYISRDPFHLACFFGGHRSNIFWDNYIDIFSRFISHNYTQIQLQRSRVKTMNKLEFQNVTKKYGRTTALSNVSFSCKEAEFFTLFGPSGAGKTTCLELIAGIEKDYSGKILLENRDVKNVTIQDRNISMAFENYSLYPHLSVNENIAFPLRSPRAQLRSEQEIQKIVEKNASDLGIEHLLDRNPVQLSGGQKQRVSLARALVREPAAFLLDEPIAHLDAKLRTIARANLKEIALNLGTTIVYVTHDFREALGLSDRICVLRDGIVEQIGTPQEIWNDPNSDFVGHMVGEPVMNFIDGFLLEENEVLYFKSQHLTVTLPLSKKNVLKNNVRNVRLGIRPNDLIASQRESMGENCLEVFGFERKSNNVYIHVDASDRLLIARSDVDNPMKVGSYAHLGVMAENIHIFEKSFEVSR